MGDSGSSLGVGPINRTGVWRLELLHEVVTHPDILPDLRILTISHLCLLSSLHESLTGPQFESSSHGTPAVGVGVLAANDSEHACPAYTADNIYIYI